MGTVIPINPTGIHKALLEQLSELVHGRNETLRLLRLSKEIEEMRKQIRDMGQEPCA